MEAKSCDLLKWLNVAETKRSPSRLLEQELTLYSNGVCHMEALELLDLEYNRQLSLTVSSSGGSVKVFCRPSRFESKETARVELDSSPVGECLLFQSSPANLTVQLRALASELIHGFRAKFSYLLTNTDAPESSAQPAIYESLLPTDFKYSNGDSPHTLTPKWPVFPFSAAESRLFFTREDTNSVTVASIDGDTKVTLSGNRQRWRAEFPVAVISSHPESFQLELLSSRYAIVEQEGSIDSVPDPWSYPLFAIFQYLDKVSCAPSDLARQPKLYRLPHTNVDCVQLSHPTNQSEFCFKPSQRAERAILAKVLSFRGNSASFQNQELSNGAARTVKNGQETLTCTLIIKEEAEASRKETEAEVVYVIELCDKAYHAILCRTEVNGQFLRIWGNMHHHSSASNSAVMSMEHLPQYFHLESSNVRFDLSLVKSLVTEMLFKWQEHSFSSMKIPKVSKGIDNRKTVVVVPGVGHFAAFGSGIVCANFEDRTIIRWRMDVVSIYRWYQGQGDVRDQREPFTPTGLLEIIEPSGEVNSFEWSTAIYMSCSELMRAHVRDVIDFAKWAFAPSDKVRTQFQVERRFGVRAVDECIKRNREILDSLH